MEDIILENKAGVARILEDILLGKAIDSHGEVIFTKEMRVLPETIQMMDFNEDDPDYTKEAYINGTLNANFLSYDVVSGERFLRTSFKYDPAEWEMYFWHYSVILEEPLHALMFHPKTGRADVVVMEYTCPDVWWIEKSTFLFVR